METKLLEYLGKELTPNLLFWGIVAPILLFIITVIVLVLFRKSIWFKRKTKVWTWCSKIWIVYIPSIIVILGFFVGLIIAGHKSSLSLIRTYETDIVTLANNYCSTMVTDLKEMSKDEHSIVYDVNQQYVSFDHLIDQYIAENPILNVDKSSWISRTTVKITEFISKAIVKAYLKYWISHEVEDLTSIDDKAVKILLEADFSENNEVHVAEPFIKILKRLISKFFISQYLHILLWFVGLLLPVGIEVWLGKKYLSSSE